MSHDQSIPPGSPQENTSLALNILGNPSPELQNGRNIELAALRGKLANKLKISLSDEEGSHLVEGVLLDCVSRGLPKGQDALRPEETVSPAFTRGLQERIAIRNAYRAAVESYIPLNCFTDNEEALVSLPPISTSFQQLEDTLPLVKGRYGAVRAFHAALFGIPPLEVAADALRPIAVEQLDPFETLPGQEQFMANNGLVANFIIAAGLRQTADIALRPQDVADLAALWKNDKAREAFIAGAIAFMGRTAEDRFGISRRQIEAYTEATLEVMNEFFIYHEIHGLAVEDLAKSPFIIGPERQPIRRQEFSTEDLVRARAAFNRLSEKAGKRQGFVGAHDVRNTSSLDLYFIFHHLAQENIAFNVHELEAYIPLRTWIGALDILQANQYREAVTGEEIPEFASAVRAEVYDRLKYRVFQTITTGDFDPQMDRAATLQLLPLPVLFEFLGIYPNTDDIDALSDDIWTAVARGAGITVTDSGNFEIPPDGDTAYLDYFNHMAPDMQVRIAGRLRNILE